ncbi:MAG: response regulator transcription factor [Anaerolineae bacterium]
MSTPIRVLLVDDHDMVRAGLAVFLHASDNLLLAGEAGSGEEALARCAELKPDVVLMDVKMPGIGGIEATRRIRHSYPAIRVIALSSYLEDGLVQQIAAAGAVGYLLKDVSRAELARAITNACRGHAVFSEEVAGILIREAAPSPLDDLTDREREVLALLATGLTNREIAGRINVAQSTVKSHISSILKKLDASNRTAAVNLAHEHGLK